MSTATDLRLVTPEEVDAAAARIAGFVVPTPLLELSHPDGVPLLGKAESLQRTGSFKLRGAVNAIAALDAESRERGVVAHSSGNHGQAVARAARQHGIAATVYMPAHAPRLKIERARADGAEVVLVGRSSAERAERAREHAERDGATLVASAGDPLVIAGQGTVGLEIAEQLGDCQPCVLAPVGGGGLASGVATAVKALLPGATVVGVEPELAADAAESLRAGQLVAWPAERVDRTLADGLRLTSLTPLTFAHLRARLDGVVLVSEQEIVAAMRWAAHHARLVLEPSGAVPLAAALYHRGELPPADVLVPILSGGNVDPNHFFELGLAA